MSASGSRPVNIVCDAPPTHHRLPYLERLGAALCEGGDALPSTLTLDGTNYPGSASLDAVMAGEVESVRSGRLRRIPTDALDAYVLTLRKLGGAA